MADVGGNRLDSSNLSDDFSSWMADLPKELHDTPLNCLSIPGSHNSFSSDLDLDSPIVDENETIKKIVEMFGKPGRKILRSWSVTQDSSLTLQLKAGIRYFDFRVAAKPGTEEVYLVHGLLTTKTVEEFLREMKSYLDEHPKEVILVDMNHFYNMTEFSHKQTLSMILEVFGHKMCPHLDVASVTLNMLWQSGLQVIVFYHNSVVESNSHFWPGSAVPSPWANTNKQKQLLKFLEQNFTSGRPQGSFYVTQGILTPEFQDIFLHLDSSLKAEIAKPNNSTIVKWVQSKHSGPSGVNICILDFVEMASFISTVIQLNHKKNP